MTSLSSILVVDDVEKVGEFIEAATKSLGVPWKLITDLSSLPKLLTPETKLILLDPAAKKGGMDVLRLLGEQHCNLDIVLMSGNVTLLRAAGEMAVKLDLSIAAHLRKPFSPAALQEVLKRFISDSDFRRGETDPGVDFDQAELLRALEHDEFVLHYQPQIELNTGKVIGLEGFARWENPEKGIMFPDSFMGGVRELGLLGRFDELLVHRGLADLKQLANAQNATLRLTLKLSSASLTNPAFADTFLALLKQHGAGPQKSVVEVSLNEIASDFGAAYEILTRLRMNNVQVAVDDYGLGDTRIHHLRCIWATELKINKTFVQNMFATGNDCTMVQKIILIAHEMYMTVLAEGVETLQQLEFLCKMQCDYAQGYHFSIPLAPEPMAVWLKEYRTVEFRRLLDV